MSAENCGILSVVALEFRACVHIAGMVTEGHQNYTSGDNKGCGEKHLLSHLHDPHETIVYPFLSHISDSTQSVRVDIPDIAFDREHCRAWDGYGFELCRA